MDRLVARRRPAAPSPWFGRGLIGGRRHGRRVESGCGRWIRNSGLRGEIVGNKEAGSFFFLSLPNHWLRQPSPPHSSCFPLSLPRRGRLGKEEQKPEGQHPLSHPSSSSLTPTPMVLPIQTPLQPHERCSHPCRRPPRPHASPPPASRRASADAGGCAGKEDVRAWRDRPAEAAEALGGSNRGF